MWNIILYPVGLTLNTAVKPRGPSNNKMSAVLLLSVDEDYYYKFAQIK